jgi:uncharacterized protein GlcG (DUF336 family)
VKPIRKPKPIIKEQPALSPEQIEEIKARAVTETKKKGREVDKTVVKYEVRAL